MSWFELWKYKNPMRSLGGTCLDLLYSTKKIIYLFLVTTAGRLSQPVAIHNGEY